MSKSFISLVLALQIFIQTTGLSPVWAQEPSSGQVTLESWVESLDRELATKVVIEDVAGQPSTFAAFAKDPSQGLRFRTLSDELLPREFSYRLELRGDRATLQVFEDVKVGGALLTMTEFSLARGQTAEGTAPSADQLTSMIREKKGFVTALHKVAGLSRATEVCQEWCDKEYLGGSFAAPVLFLFSIAFIAVSASILRAQTGPRGLLPVLAAIGGGMYFVFVGTELLDAERVRGSYQRVTATLRTKLAQANVEDYPAIEAAFRDRLTDLRKEFGIDGASGMESGRPLLYSTTLGVPIGVVLSVGLLLATQVKAELGVKRVGAVVATVALIGFLLTALVRTSRYAPLSAPEAIDREVAQEIDRLFSRAGK